MNDVAQNKVKEVIPTDCLAAPGSNALEIVNPSLLVHTLQHTGKNASELFSQRRRQAGPADGSENIPESPSLGRYFTPVPAQLATRAR